MSSLKDLLGFELFNLKDMWKGIKKDPERLFLGAAEPLGSSLWGGILGKDYEPLIDQMGGPYGGSAISAFGNTDGGVYGRAEAAGIDTNAGRNMNNIAHIVAALMAGNYAMGQMPQGAQSNNQFSQFNQMRPPQQQQQQPQQIPNLYMESLMRKKQREEMLAQLLGGNYGP
jgi:hypothetical protein